MSRLFGPRTAEAVIIPIVVFLPQMGWMKHSVLIFEIREIRGQELLQALPWMIEDQRRFVLGAVGCGRTRNGEAFKVTASQPGGGRACL